MSPETSPAAIRIFSTSPAGFDSTKLRQGDETARVKFLGKPLHGRKFNHYTRPMSKFRRWVPSIVCLLALWLGVVVVVRMISSGKPSTASTLALLDSWPALQATESARREWIDRFASRLAGLDLDSRHLVLLEPRLRSAFNEMLPADQTHFLSATEQAGMPHFLLGSKRWNRGRYERLFQPALADLEQLQAGSRKRLIGMLIEPEKWNADGEGIEFTFRNATAPLTRFDALPLIERVRKHSEFGR